MFYTSVIFIHSQTAARATPGLLTTVQVTIYIIFLIHIYKKNYFDICQEIFRLQNIILQLAINKHLKKASWLNVSQQKKNDNPECFHGCKTTREIFLSAARKLQFKCKLSQTLNSEQY